MKTHITNIITRVAAIIIAITFFTFPACLKNKNDKGESTTNQEQKISKPKVDINTAAFTGNLEEVKKHIHHKSDLNKKDLMGGSTPLITACVFGKTEVAKALIDAGADLNLQNREGSTALHCAAFFCYEEITAYLVKHKADQSIKNKQGTTASQSMMGEFAQVKPFYEAIEKQLKPLGLKFDYEHLEKTRPIIRDLLNVKE